MSREGKMKLIQECLDVSRIVRESEVFHVFVTEIPPVTFSLGMWGAGEGSKKLTIINKVL